MPDRLPALLLAIIVLSLLPACTREVTESEDMPVALPAAPADSTVDVVIAQRSGVLSLGGGAGGLLNADLTHPTGYAPEIVYKTRDGAPARLVLRQRQPPATLRSQTSQWVVHLSPEPALSLDARLGVGLFSLALGGLNVEEAAIRVDGGSATTVDLTGYWPHDATVNVTAGPGSVTVALPRGTGARVDVFGENVSVDEGPMNVVEPGVFTNDAYGQTAHTLAVRIVAFGGEVGFAEGLPVDRTVAEALDAARTLYSSEAWGCAEKETPANGAYSEPQSVGELWDDYICERGPDHITLDGGNPLTAELARSELLDDIRRTYYEGDANTLEDMLAFNIPEFVSATGDVMMAMNERQEMAVSITHFIGSFEYSVEPEGDRLRFTVTNQTDRASGTHIPLRFPDAGYTATVESLVEADPALAEAYVGEVIASARYPLIALLDAKTREETDEAAGEGGGAYVQTFTWTEARLREDASTLPPWPAYTDELDIR